MLQHSRSFLAFMLQYLQAFKHRLTIGSCMARVMVRAIMSFDTHAGIVGIFLSRAPKIKLLIERLIILKLWFGSPIIWKDNLKFIVEVFQTICRGGFNLDESLSLLLGGMVGSFKLECHRVCHVTCWLIFPLPPPRGNLFVRVCAVRGMPVRFNALFDCRSSS